ncbi:MAG: amino acid adenylation domain-containing protein [Gemmatimonadota bacterium]
MSNPVDQTVVLPLSFAQERLWFLDRFAPGSPLYNIPAVLSFSGALDVRALGTALAEIVRRHEVLRTTFREVDGAPAQVIAPSAELVLPVLDLARLGAAERLAESRRRATAAAETPFDLEAGPLFRASLLRLKPDEYSFLLVIHHIVADGWSTGVFFRELSSLYDAYSDGRESPLPELEVQYGDFAVWQREQLGDEVLGRELAWWRERLAGAPELLELPTDRPRPAVQTHRGTHERVELPAALADRLGELARREGATLFMVVLGAFQALLARYAGTDDVVVGSPIAGRTQRELEALIGFFVNTLVLRTDLSGDPTFRETVRRVRAVTLGAYEHQEVPFERLVEELAPERSLSRSPLFQVMFSLQSTENSPEGLPGLRMGEGVEAELHTAKFDLALALTLHAAGLRASVAYSTDLFERATVLRMLAHFRRLLEQAAADPDARLSELALLDGEERRRVLEEWSRAAEEVPADGTVHRLFEAQAARAPDAPALAFGGETLLYGELNARANRLAHHLRGLGVGPEARVGICLPRTPEMVAALLAVLKAGGAYVPLDPDFPRERLGWMLEDAGARLVLTESALADRLPAGAGAVRLDAIADELRALPAADPEGVALPENLSHVVFTSGSTGRPKGVMIRHSSVVALLHWLRGTVTDEERSAVLASTSTSFDVSVAEIWGTLCWGGRLLLAENALSLAEMEDAGVVLATMVPTAAAELLRTGAVPPSVRAFNLAGEALPESLARGLYDLGTVETVRNLYGPTEDTTYSTYSLVPRGAERVAIGRPIANSRAYVLDGALAPVPAGIPGELYLAGDGTARGYASRPDLTAERFLPDPFGPPGSRMYRVMDRARWTDAGELVYLGRTDTQVKVRGFRIELGEIESVLLAHPAVRAAVALAREDAPGERRLVAYVVPEGAAPDADALRAHLRERLPAYMLPAAFVVLDALPLTPSGKLDRRALPAPDFAAAERYAAPATPVEEVLAGIWAEILRADRVGVRETFFELGGHSLLAIRVVSRVRDALGVELPLRALFEAPTVAELAARVEALRRAELPVLPPVVPVECSGPLPLSFAQERLWFLDRLEPGSAFYNIPAALRMGGDLDLPALESALGEIVRRHEALRTVFAEVDGAPAQAVVPFGGFALAVEDLSRLGEGEREAEAGRRAAADAARPFDLARGPLFRAALLRLADDDHVLLLCLHHAVSDAWSLDVLFRELSALYGAYREGGESPLPELPVQYADFAVWQREQLRGEALERQLAWWRERLAGAPALLELPTDRPRPPVQTYRGATERVELSAELLDRLQALARGEGATLFMTLLAAWQALLARYAGTEDVVVGSPIAGRTRRETEGLIGFFLNTLVLRTDLGGDPSFREVLRRVREATLGAYEHQEVPFERLVEELQPERSLGHAPLFQVMLVLQEPERAGGGLPGLELSRVGAAGGTAKFDLTLALARHPGGLTGTLEYATDLFERATARRMIAHLGRVLEQATADPDARLADLDLLGDAERAQVIDGWNRTEAEYPADRCIHHLFEEQAARTPDAVAVVSAEGTLTYRELDERADRLARHLAGLGVVPDARAALCLERGHATMVALLGILKAGGACVPLDPSYPSERLAHMLEDSAARVLVTQRSLVDRLPEFGGETVLFDGTPGEHDTAALTPRPPLPMLGEGEQDGVSVEHSAEGRETLPQNWGRVASLSEPGGGDPADASRVSVSPDSLAYVVFTSGSTGRPKGVAMPHRPLVSLLEWQRRDWRAPGAATTLQFAPVSFDVSFQEIFSCWASGGRVVLISEELRYDPAGLLEVVEREGVERLFMPSVALQHLAEAAEARGLVPSRLREVVTAGEQLRVTEPLRRWLAAVGAPLHNQYGPSETHVATALALEGDPAAWPLLPAIGAPVANARCYVLDGGLRPAPVGVPGELYLGGACVARGYLGRPDLTAERFLPDPFAAEPGARVYRTGDRARWLADGNLEFLGRADEQVKLRGFRIEPGEVEAALEAQPGVREAVVVVREDVPGERRLVAYVVADEGAEADAAALKAGLAGRLPEYMVPSAFVALERLPLTPSGKVARRALPAPEPAVAEEAYVAPRLPLEQTVAAIWVSVLGLERVGVNLNFFDLGGHSLLLARVQAKLRDALGREVPIVDLFRFPTVASLAAHLGGETAAEEPRPLPRRAERDGRGDALDGAVAVIGLAGRFPGAPDVETFWSNLRGGVHSITFFKPEELEAAGLDPALLRDPSFVPAAGVMEGMDLFDAGFFGFNPREAEIIDPQQRVFLETAWEALENAGYAPGETREAVGVYAGSSASDYLHRHVLTRPDVAGAVGSLQVEMGNGKDFLASRVAYKLNLRGPALAVQTACSTGLVAVHVACRALLAGECDMALAGGVGARRRGGYMYSPGGIMSPDGHCRAFDARSGGTVTGSGVGIVVLKRLADALADGDTVHAVIRGTAINNDGSGKVGYTAPSVDGQAAVIREALARAGVDPRTVGYVEAHGTGTELGDPVEVAALTQAFGSGPRRRSVALGAVKSNVGHLDSAAGITGFIKTVLALEHGEIPPSLHFEEPNPRIDFAGSPFFVNTELRPWPTDGGPRRAGVSSFGIGGTNAHVVLEEPPRPAPSRPARDWQLLVLSARTPTALEAATDRLAAHLRAHPELPLADVAWTLQAGRRAWEHRRAVVARDAEEAARALDPRAPDRVSAGAAPETARRAAFLFPGLGSHYAGMGRGLYESEPVFRDAVDRCAEILRPHLGLDLREVLYPADAPAADGAGFGGIDLRAMLGRAAAEQDDDAQERLNRTQLAQPALFVTEYALHRLWAAWGVRPAAMLGHSLGEWVAATVAGVWSLEDALMLVAERARLIESLPEGGMMGISLPEEQARPLLTGNLYVGALHGPSITVVSGPGEELDALRGEVEARGLVWRRLPMKHAFHTPLMEPVAERLMALLRGVELNAPRIPFVSNVTGTWIRASEATDPAYWARHLCEPVRFSDGVETLARDGFRLFLENGPGLALRMLAGQLDVWGGEAPAFVASMRHAYERHPDAAHVLGAAGRLWTAGAAVDWRALHAGERPRRVPLPTYPFERSRFWLEPGTMALLPAGRGGDPLARLPDPADWLYLPAWSRAPLPAQRAAEPAEWLVLADAAGLGARLAARLERQGHTVVLAEVGGEFSRSGDRSWTLRPGSADDLASLRDELHEEGIRPRRVVHLWGIDPEGGDGEDAFVRAQARGYATVAALAATFVPGDDGAPFRLVVVTEGVRDVFGGEAVRPERATVLGACLSLPQEHSHAVCRTVDVRSAGAGEHLLDQLAAEVAADTADDTPVALRGPWRWTLGYEPVQPREGRAGLREGGAYLFTGGMAGGADVLAGRLAASPGARIALVADPDFPEPAEWDLRLATAPAGSAQAAAIRGIRAAESRGARTLVLRADPRDPAEVRAAVEAVLAEFGELHGVVHTAGPGAGAAHGPLAESQPAAVAEAMGRVARGLDAIDAATAGLALDFRLLQNSVFTVFGGAGLGAATAAFALLDAWAQRRLARGGAGWTSVGWDRWHLEGDDAAAGGAILRGDGPAAFAALATLAEEPRVVVSTQDLGARLERFRAPRAAARPAGGGEPAPGLHARPSLGSEFLAPASDAEKRLAAIWGGLLGIRDVGARDNFFDLGGHSLLGLQLLARVREAFRVELPLRAVFEAPTIAELAALLEEAAGQELGQVGEAAPSNWRAAGVQPLVRRERQGDPPLSFAQERLWFVDRLQPGSTAYNLNVGLRLPGDTDAAALGRALGEIVRRHESLRTTFREEGGVPLQVIAPFAGFALPVEDLSGLPEDEREAEVRRRAARDAAHVFDLAAGPLFRATLLRVGEAEQVLLLCTHHIVSDGWSHKVLLQEISVLYDAFGRGAESPLPELPVQYADFAVWQREQAEGMDGGQLAYWKRRLAGAPELLELPTDRPRPPVPSLRGARVPVAVPASVLDRLREVARREGATLHMVVLASFGALLGRWAGSDDVVVGTPVAGRSHRELEGMIGLFVNTLVLRTDLSGDPGFREAVRRARETALGAYQHQDVPFERIVAELHPRRSLSHAALFQVSYALDDLGAGQAAPGGPPSKGGVTAEPETAQFDLTLSLTARPGGLGGTLEYATDLFDAGTARRMADHLERLLEQVAADPELRLSDVELLDQAERRRIVEEWNATAAPLPAEPLVHRLFEAQAARTPDAVALVAADGTLTYRELDARADGLARRLAELGAGPDVLVGICLERGAGMVAALLAVLKAGAAYLPLDPGYPADRLAYMLEDSGAALLLTQASLRGLVPAGGVRTLLLDEDGDGGSSSAVSHSRTFALPHSPSPDNTAYVIYTSGSTGRPKGVVVTHRNAVNFLAGMDGRVGGTVPGTWLAVTRISFDIHVLELFWTLARGFRVVVHPGLEQGGRDGGPAPWIARHGVTHLQCTPSLAAMMIAECGAEALSGLERVILGGEAMPPALAAQIDAVVPGGLVNMYGPTETTVWSVTHEVARAEGTLPIGTPIANLRTYVLDGALRPQPVGVPGELFIGGAGVARGYLGRPGLTAERFVPDPFSAEPGARVYRTGDRARWREDGALEYLGRLDEQVKVRGFRIEPGEIEAALASHPAVREAAVVAREDVPGDRRLVAYVAAADGAPLVPAELKAHLGARLPEYMVPGAFVVLDALPLTPSGKVARRALPAPELTSAGAGYVAPRTPTEELLASVYAEVLRVERVGVAESFFDLGGHSLLAVRVASRVRDALGVELTVRALFEAPGVAELAERVDALRRTGAPEQTRVVPVERSARRRVRERPRT